MATGDFLDLAREACFASRRDPDDADDLARAKRHVNDALNAVYGDDIEFDFLQFDGQITTVAGANVYLAGSIASALGVSGDVTVLDVTMDEPGYGGVLDMLDWEDLERLAFSTADGDTEDVPRFCAFYNGRLKLYPTPDRVYSLGVRVKIVPGELVNDTDTCLVPNEWLRRVVINPAAASLMLEESGGEAMNQALYVKSQYEKDMERLRLTRQAANEQSISFAQPGLNRDLYGVDSPLNPAEDF